VDASIARARVEAHDATDRLVARFARIVVDSRACVRARAMSGKPSSSSDESARVRLTARAEALARALLKTANVGFRRNDARASRMTATSARKVYDSLLGQGFRASDIEDAMRDACDATGGSFVEADALDRLCMNVPNARLPRRFQTVERSEFKLDADASVEATAAQATAPAPRRGLEAPDERMTRVTGKKDGGDAKDDVAVDKAWIARYAEYEDSDSDDSDESDDGYDSLEDFGLSEEEVAAKRMMWNKRKEYARDPEKVTGQFRDELAGLKTRASEAKKGKNKKQQREVAEAIRNLKLMATELGIDEDDIEQPKVHEKKLDSRAPTGAGDEVLPSVTETADVDVDVRRAENASTPKPAESDDSDDEAFGLDVFGDDADDVIGTGEEDPLEAIIKMFKHELLFSDGKRASAANAQSAKSSKSKKDDKVEEMTPKNMLTQLAKREGWLVPRFERDKSADVIRYVVSVERSSGPKYKRKPTLVCSTHADDEPSESGWISINDAQNGAAARALFEATFSAENQLVPLELPSAHRELWIRWAVAFMSSDVANVGEDTRDVFISTLLKSVGDAASTTRGVGDSSTKDRHVDDGGKQNVAPPAKINLKARAATSEALKAQFEEMKRDPQWQKMFEKRSQLPICALSHELLDRLRTHDAVVVCGETGCGKTTQAPQFLLDDAIERGQGGGCNIVCTQPRRVAATSIAERVSAERCEKNGVGGHGSLVGHHVRLDAKVTDSTRLTFCTTGILLRRLQGDAMLSNVTHVVVDEVHERSLDGDFLLTLLRDLPRRRREAGLAPLKLVLMSATLNAALFSDYLGGAPVISAPGRSYPVETIHLEQIYDALEYVIDPDNRSCRRPNGKVEDAMKAIKAGGGGDRRRQNELLASWGEDAASEFGGEENPENPDYDPSKYEQCKRSTRLSLSRLNESVIDYDLIEELLAYVDDETDDGAVLVFLPGIGEVTGLLDRLGSSPRFKDAVLCPLHSALTNAEQRNAFRVPRPGTRKIVVATNVAETSVTIEDIVVVIDSGRVKERQWDPRRGMASLEEGWVSRAAAKQRAGRAGRVRAGTCYALFTSHRSTGAMRPFQVPEMHRAPLTEVVLQIASLDLHNDAAAVLGNAPEPPKDEAIAAAKKTLTEIGAFDDASRLTALGRHLAALPVDARVAKMLLFGAILRCLSPVLTIAATLSYKSPFQSSKTLNTQVEAAMRAFAQPASTSLAAGQQSDHLVFAAAYDGYVEACRESRNAGRRFAQKNALDVDTIRQITEMRTQYASLLADMGAIKVPAGYSLRGRNTSWLDDPKAVRFFNRCSLVCLEKNIVGDERFVLHDDTFRAHAHAVTCASVKLSPYSDAETFRRRA